MGKSKGQMKSRLSYSAGAFGNDVFYATLSTYFIMFVTTHLFNTGDPKQNSHYVLLITKHHRYFAYLGSIYRSINR